MVIAENQDGDNAEGSSIADPSTSTPDVTLAPDVQNGTNGIDWSWCMQSFDGCLEITPTFTFPAANFDIGRTFANATPNYSYNGIDWFEFDNASVSTDLLCSNNNPFTSDKVQVSLGRPYTWTRMRNYVENWVTSPWASETLSSIAEGGTEYVFWTSPPDTDLSTAARPIPAQESLSFKVSHPGYSDQFKRNLVIMCGNHATEYNGHEVFVKFVNQLLDGGSDAITLLKHYVVYAYPMINPASYVSPNRQYAGAIVDYDYGSEWDNPNSQVQEPVRDRIEIDISGVADAVIDFHSLKSGLILAQSYYQTGTRPDDYNGDDATWFSLYGTHQYWYQYFLAEIIPSAVAAGANNVGAIRQYARDNWSTLVGTTIEIGQPGIITESDSVNCAAATMHMLNQLVRNGRTDLPRKNALGIATW